MFHHNFCAHIWSVPDMELNQVGGQHVEPAQHAYHALKPVSRPLGRSYLWKPAHTRQHTECAWLRELIDIGECDRAAAAIRELHVSPFETLTKGFVLFDAILVYTRPDNHTGFIDPRWGHRKKRAYQRRTQTHCYVSI